MAATTCADGLYDGLECGEHTEAVVMPTQIRDSYFAADVHEMQKLLMRYADASRASAHFRATNEFIACESK